MQLKIWCQTDIGLRRDQNQDSFLIDEGIGLFVVADGMGGHRGGEVASSMAVETVREIVLRHFQDKRKMVPRQVIMDAYREASNRIYDKSHGGDSPELVGMGTTLVAALFVEQTLYIGNVGDSRAYLYSPPHFWQITEDHSLINEQVRAGLLSEKDIPSFGAKNVITRSVGFEREVACDVIERSLEPGELVLICSDGLSGLVSDAKIAEICRTFPPSDIVSKCINEAKNNGGDDNITVMVVYAEPRLDH